MSEKIKLLLVDDHTVVRNGTRLMLADADDIEIAGEAASGHEALALLRKQDFHVALVDISLPDRSGLDLVRQMRDLRPKLAVLVLTMYSENVYAVRALRQGAAGYLTKSCTASTVVAAVRQAASGGKYVTPELVEKLAGMLGGEEHGGHDSLSDRELEVMKLIARGESLVHIAEQLHLSPSTVTTYRARILEKMGMSSNAELTRYAVEHGLLV